MDVLAICGSVRVESFNAMLVRTLPLLAPEGMKIVAASSIEPIPPYNADLQTNGFPDVVTRLGEAIRKADGLILATPEYNYSIPGILKNAIDWVSRLPNQPFKNKPIALQSTSQAVLGGARAQYHLRQVLVAVEGQVLNRPEVFVSGVQNRFEAGELCDETTCNLIRLQLETFEVFIRGIKRNAAQ
jgi:chromate reductase